MLGPLEGKMTLSSTISNAYISFYFQIPKWCGIDVKTILNISNLLLVLFLFQSVIFVYIHVTLLPWLQSLVSRE